MPAAPQTKLILKSWQRDRFAFGGSLLKGSHPKKKRVFSARVPMHVVLKSSQATGPRSLLRYGGAIARILADQARRHHVQLQHVANGGNHLHLLLQAPSRDHLSDFLRAISGRIAQLVAGQARTLTKGTSSMHTSFWDARPFSRLVSWGQDLRRVLRYLGLNATEAATGARRGDTRAMFERIQELLARGLLPRTPGLLAAGFS
jgi:REP element-mobilizing transposase RayT